MLKFLEVPDLHFSPRWAEISRSAAVKIKDAALDHKVDFISFPGDKDNAPIMATDRGGLNIQREIFRELLDICPVVAVEGTPSHDGPGCYGPLEDLGLVLLKPGKVYALTGYDIIQTASIPVHAHADAILFGIPELNKSTIQAQLKIPAEQANAEAENLLRQYILEYVTPMRAAHNDIPAVGLLHGNVSDAHRDNESDIILKSSDILIHTDDLAPACVDRWSLGHIHTPWESDNICAGYAGYTGIDSNPWGKTGFIPAMNLVTIDDDGNVEVERIPYGTPMRLKITTPLKKYDPEIAYWLHTSDANAEAFGGHSWSRITYDEKRIETRRVSREQADKVSSLSDLFKLIDPDVEKSALKLVESIPSSVTEHDRAPVDVHMDYLKVDGCTFFGGKTVEFDMSGLPDGMTAIMGDNGSGKSSLLSFCTPYPIVVGKDTASGRPSAIKDFFSGKDSLIEKRFTVNGHSHEHLITIKGAHTQSPKTECYLTIDGAPQLEKGTFDEMLAACEEIYGPFMDYLLTTFYVQPLQGKTQTSLMSASMTDIRNLVQSIAGIDRESEKQYALENVRALTKEWEDINSWISTALQFITDPDELQREIEESQSMISDETELLKKFENEGNNLKEKEKNVRDQIAVVDAEKKRRDTDKLKAYDLGLKAGNFEKEVQKLIIERRGLNKIDVSAVIASNDNAIKHNREIEEIEYRNNRKMREYKEHVSSLKIDMQKARSKWVDEKEQVKRKNQKDMHEYDTRQGSLSRSIASLESEIKDMDDRQVRINNPCPECGYLAPDVKSRIAALKAKRVMLADDLTKKAMLFAALIAPAQQVEPEQPVILQRLTEEYDNLSEPVLEEAPDKLPVKSEQEITELSGHADRTKEIDNKIEDLTREKNHCIKQEQEISEIEYDIDESVYEHALKIEDNLRDVRDNWSAHNKNITKLHSDIEHFEKDLKASMDRLTEISKKEKHANELDGHIGDWRYIATMLQPGKIPALELDLMLDSIDAEASRIITPYQSERFSFETLTQDQGKKGAVDRFDIMLHDSETGQSRSFLKHSPGQKAFFNDAYVKALVRKRNERAQRSYTPVIVDEADGPIQPEQIPAFYEMQNRYWDVPVLAVSHSPSSHEYIQSVVLIEELKK